MAKAMKCRISIQASLRLNGGFPQSWHDGSPTNQPTTGEPMSIEISAAISSLSAAIGLMKGAVDARDEAKVKDALMAMSDRLFAIHLQANELLAENRDLQAQINQLKEQEVERERFILHEVRPGAFALRMEPTGDDRTPVHYVCQACRGTGKKIVLRLDHSMLGPELCCPADPHHNIYVGSEYVGALQR